ncbi:F-box domain-containing protein, variant 2 [Balamuthia mandrillaris]
MARLVLQRDGLPTMEGELVWIGLFFCSCPERTHFSPKRCAEDPMLWQPLCKALPDFLLPPHHESQSIPKGKSLKARFLLHLRVRPLWCCVPLRPLRFPLKPEHVGSVEVANGLVVHGGGTDSEEERNSKPKSFLKYVDLQTGTLLYRVRSFCGLDKLAVTHVGSATDGRNSSSKETNSIVVAFHDSHVRDEEGVHHDSCLLLWRLKTCAEMFHPPMTKEQIRKGVPNVQEPSFLGSITCKRTMPIKEMVVRGDIAVTVSNYKTSFEARFRLAPEFRQGDWQLIVWDLKNQKVLASKVFSTSNQQPSRQQGGSGFGGDSGLIRGLFVTEKRIVVVGSYIWIVNAEPSLLEKESTAGQFLQLRRAIGPFQQTAICSWMYQQHPDYPDRFFFFLDPDKGLLHLYDLDRDDIVSTALMSPNDHIFCFDPRALRLVTRELGRFMVIRELLFLPHSHHGGPASISEATEIEDAKTKEEEEHKILYRVRLPGVADYAQPHRWQTCMNGELLVVAPLIGKRGTRSFVIVFDLKKGCKRKWRLEDAVQKIWFDGLTLFVAGTNSMYLWSLLDHVSPPPLFPPS